MVSLSAYDSVIHEIYEAALVPARWGSALTQMIARFAPRDWEVAFLLWERHDPPSGRFLGSAGVNAMAHDIYVQSFAGRNDWSQSSRKLRVGETAHTDELIKREQFCKSVMYREFLSHWGYGVALISMLDRHGPDQLGLVLPGPVSHGPGDLAEAVPLLQPHFRRAARISRRIAEADLRTATATDLLDGSPYAVFALGPDMELLLANASGQTLLDEGRALTLHGKRLRVADPAAQGELLAMSRGKHRERTFSVSLTDERNRQHIFTALSVTPKLGGEFDNPAGGATLMLIGGQRVGLSGDLVAQIEQSFDLSGAEARLAGHIVEGGGLEGYMKDRNVSMHAARFLLKSIYAKTGMNTRTELAALLREAPLGWVR